MDRLPCKKCRGTGKAKLPNMDMSVQCPACNGTGYEGGIPHTFQSENIQQKQEIKQQTQISIDYKEQILKQIIKYPTLFTDGILLKYQDEDPDLFIYLKNNSIFHIEQLKDAMSIKLKDQYKNKLAQYTIQYLVNKHLKNN